MLYVEVLIAVVVYASVLWAFYDGHPESVTRRRRLYSFTLTRVQVTEDGIQNDPEHSLPGRDTPQIHFFPRT